MVRAMIVREIVGRPDLIEVFDWFNDYGDTRRYLSDYAPEMLPEFDARYRDWEDAWHNRMREKALN